MSKINDLIKELCQNGVEYKPIKEIFDLFSGMTGVSNKWADEGNCQFIDYMNAYKNNKIDVKNTPYATVKNLKQNELKIGDLLLTSASEVPDECAISAVIEDDIKSAIFMDDHLFGLRLKKEYFDRINTTFVNYYLNSQPFRNNLFKAVRGVTRFYISNDNYLKLLIPIPPIEVQEEIVKILDKFDKLESELKLELEVRNKQYEFWRKKLLNKDKYKFIKIEDITNSVSSGKCSIRKEYGEYPVYGSTGIISRTDEYLYDTEKILIARVGANAGYVHIANGEYNVTDNTLIVDLKENVDLKYIYYYLQNYNLNKLAKGGGQPLITGGQIKNLEISLPPLEEQKRISTILDKFDNLVIQLTDEIEFRNYQYEYYRNKLLSFGDYNEKM